MIKRFSISICSLLLLLIVATSLEAKALTFEELPVKQSSKQWSVQIGEAEKGKDLAKPVKGKFHTYSIDVNNISKDVYSVEINMFRNEPNSKTKYSLFGCPDEQECNENRYETAKSLAKQMNNGHSYHGANFLMAEKATELEVEIVWTEDNNGRPLKETFIFAAE
ncbi:hypothetical protein AB3Z07_26845 (plasmid) [Metabacillus halosaccharovorans]|uniref:hypothetical protein n=1 Tax=Metabacillus halosaccharovorans TaxID=930124 RepID=UPI00203EB09A|nr:hypothetical protein [Metabacillus halosaccharovorans]MCM3444144.1 hypothetical protein [Metabacillus halosaccharovorans]